MGTRRGEPGPVRLASMIGGTAESPGFATILAMLALVTALVLHDRPPRNPGPGCQGEEVLFEQTIESQLIEEEWPSIGRRAQVQIGDLSGPSERITIARRDDVLQQGRGRLSLRVQQHGKFVSRRSIL